MKMRIYLILCLGLCWFAPSIKAQNKPQSGQSTSWQLPQSSQASSSSQRNSSAQGNAHRAPSSEGCSINPPPEKDCTKQNAQQTGQQTGQQTRPQVIQQTRRTTRQTARTGQRHAPHRATTPKSVRKKS